MKLGARSVTLVFVRDISERRAYTESLEHRALHDALTGLANRTLFEGQLDQALALAHRTEETRAVLIMDLDGFKQVNDTLGHDHGDRLLQQVADPPGERAARTGHDRAARRGRVRDPARRTPPTSRPRRRWR